MPVDTSEGSPHYGLAAAPTGLVAWAEGGNLQTSDLGLDWLDVDAGPDDANVAAIVPVGDRLVMLGDAVRDRVGAWSSHDGTAWSPLEHAPPLGMAAGTEVGGGGIVAVGRRDQPCRLVHRTDGNGWRAIPPVASRRDDDRGRGGGGDGRGDR